MNFFSRHVADAGKANVDTGFSVISEIFTIFQYTTKQLAGAIYSAQCCHTRNWNNPDNDCHEVGINRKWGESKVSGYKFKKDYLCSAVL